MDGTLLARHDECCSVVAACWGYGKELLCDGIYSSSVGGGTVLLEYRRYALE